MFSRSQRHRRGEALGLSDGGVFRCPAQSDGTARAHRGCSAQLWLPGRLRWGWVLRAPPRPHTELSRKLQGWGLHTGLTAH